MSEIAKMMGGLPMSELIGGPLVSVVSAQTDLAHVMIGYVNDVGFEDVDSGKARILEFNIKKPVISDDQVTTTDMTIQAPILGLLPIPALLVDHVSIDFQMEVTASSEEKSNTAAEASASASGKFWGCSYSVSGKVSTSKENTRSTNQTAKYQVHVEANQQPQTECLGKLMDMFSTCTEAIKIGNTTEAV
ncbi:MAG: DUF2589 domain-containing protein [Spirochaetia bacterium]|jgi:hypothetical protein|nr:DUF2589 domain-containing protein [Spirochaetia bacterium]